MSDKKITTKFLKMLGIGIPMWYNTIRSNEEDKNMKTIADIINANRSTIETDIRECYREVLETDGRVQYQIYIWEDGEIEHLYEAQGSHCWLQPRDSEPRALYHITTLEAQCFDWRDYAERLPEEPDEDDYDDSDAYEAAKQTYEAACETARTEVIDRWLAEEEDEDERDTLDSQKSDIEDAIRILRSVR